MVEMNGLLEGADFLGVDFLGAASVETATTMMVVALKDLAAVVVDLMAVALVEVGKVILQDLK
jgi:hypothetical protein